MLLQRCVVVAFASARLVSGSVLTRKAPLEEEWP